MSETHSSQWLQPGFADSVQAAQSSFRIALKALAEPGLVQPLSTGSPLDTLHPALFALCLTLLDQDTPVWLAPALDTPAVRANLAFHCGCPFVSDREVARFALIDESMLNAISAFDCGNERFPDQSCTLLIQLASLAGGHSMRWVGPGIPGTREVSLPLNSEFWQLRRQSNAFPCGLDMFFIAGEQLIGLPRSTLVFNKLEEVA